MNTNIKLHYLCYGLNCVPQNPHTQSGSALVAPPRYMEENEILPQKHTKTQASENPSDKHLRNMSSQFKHTHKAGES